MASSLSNLVNNLAEKIHKIKCKYGDDNKCEKCGIKYKDCKLKIRLNIKLKLISFIYLCWDKTFQKVFYEDLKKRSANTYNFFNHDINKFILLLQKGVYPQEYMDHWEKCIGTSLPQEKDFYSHLNMEDMMQITHTQKPFVKILK